MWWYSENHPINFKKLNFVFLHAGALAVILIVVFVKFDTIANGFAQKVKRNFSNKRVHISHAISTTYKSVKWNYTFLIATNRIGFRLHSLSQLYLLIYKTQNDTKKSLIRSNFCINKNRIKQTKKERLINFKNYHTWFGCDMCFGSFFFFLLYLISK